MLILKILAVPFVLVLTLLAAGCIAVFVLAFLVSTFWLPAIGD